MTLAAFGDDQQRLSWHRPYVQLGPALVRYGSLPCCITMLLIAMTYFYQPIFNNLGVVDPNRSFWSGTSDRSCFPTRAYVIFARRKGRGS